MQPQQIEKLETLLEKSHYLKLVKPFTGLISQFEIDHENYLVNMDTNLQANMLGSHKHFSVWECYAEQDLMLPGHKHDVDEAVVVLSGELTRVENGRKYTPQEMLCIHKYELHSFFIKGGTRFLLIFCPPIEVKKRESYG